MTIQKGDALPILFRETGRKENVFSCHTDPYRLLCVIGHADLLVFIVIHKPKKCSIQSAPSNHWRPKVFAQWKGLPGPIRRNVKPMANQYWVRIDLCSEIRLIPTIIVGLFDLREVIARILIGRTEWAHYVSCSVGQSINILHWNSRIYIAILVTKQLECDFL